MEKEKTVRLLDVAHRAGVGVGTASRVLNGEPTVGEDKRRRVLAAMEELGYRRNAIAASLKGRKTRTLGVVIPDVANEFYSEIVRGVEDAARSKQYNIILCSTDGSTDREQQTLSVLSEKQVDGLILLSYHLGGPIEEKLKEMDLPVALISTLTNEDAFITVNISNERAAQEATEYLIGLGHRRIAMLAGPSRDADGGENRLKGYQNALSRHGLLFEEALVERSEAYTYESGYQKTQKLLQKGRPFTAVFAASDHMAIGCIKALGDNGLSVPEDISVMGFDNLSITAYAMPTITTISQPRYEMGRFAAHQLCRELNGEAVEQRHKIMDHKIVPRASVKPLEQIHSQ